MSSRTVAVALAGALAVGTAAIVGLSAQSLTYTRGQNVAPAYEGWEQAPDGTKYFVFGYMNRNWEEEVDVPIGPANGFAPGDPDQGQPTHFLPRRNRFLFRVRVPTGFGAKDELVWTLTSHGRTEKAYASLRPDYILDDVVKASETGALGAGTSSPEVRSNKPPTVHIVEVKARSVTIGEPITVTTEVKDDGIPKPRGAGLAGAAVSNRGAGNPDARPGAERTVRRNRAMEPPQRVTVGKNVGLYVSCFLYRGPSGATVTFDPPQVKPWEDTRTGANSPWSPIWSAPPIPKDGRQPVKVTFSEPGTYVLRCRADDGALFGDDEVTIAATR